ncbi:hypothetical protein GCM10022247_66040 [Allokutzneria multivorans]|uniref:HTH marR-type domain-containing protein n=1 Tax=Allokutzneria multivorans TaxID=1142134 RepID=A0ABP7TV63_9PSEU
MSADTSSANAPRAAHETSGAVRQLLLAGAEAQVALAKRLGVNATDAAALDHLFSAGHPVGPAELSRRLGITTASATAVTDRLVRSGHVDRVPDAHDRRRHALTPTGKAHRDLLGALQPLITAIDAASAALSPAERDTVAAYLSDVAARIRDYARTSPHNPA